jgi:hypothetical protein
MTILNTLNSLISYLLAIRSRENLIMAWYFNVMMTTLILLLPTLVTAQSFAFKPARLVQQIQPRGSYYGGIGMTIEFAQVCPPIEDGVADCAGPYPGCCPSATWCSGGSLLVCCPSSRSISHQYCIRRMMLRVGNRR